MKIGIVMSKPPSYSETFFNSKIIGLKNRGFEVILFVQKNDILFNLCETRSAPKVYKKREFLQFFEYVKVIFRLLGIPKRLYRFINLERKANRSWNQLLKNIYNNSHILRSQVDWLHFGFTTMALQSEHVAKAIDAKMAISCRGYDMDVYPLKHNNAYKLLWGNVDKVHAISNYLLEKAEGLGLSKTTRSSIITPAIDTGKFVMSDIYSEPTSELRFLTVARLHWIKGIISTLEALALLIKDGISFTYTIIGEGSEYEPIVFAIHQLGLKDYVILLSKQPHDSIISYMKVSDVYIQYSHSEGFCNAVIEAQAMGLLCIVSDGGALPENVIHEQTGWVVEKRNPEALYKTLIKVIHLSESNKSIIRNFARTRVVGQFDITEQQQKFNTFYE